MPKGKKKYMVPTSTKEVKSMLKAHHIDKPHKSTVKSLKKLGKLKLKSLQKRGR